MKTYGIMWKYQVNTLVHFVYGSCCRACFDVEVTSCLPWSMMWHVSRRGNTCVSHGRMACTGSCDACDSCDQDREEAVGLYYAANNLMSLTFFGRIARPFSTFWRLIHSWQLQGYARMCRRRPRWEQVAWQLNILNWCSCNPRMTGIPVLLVLILRAPGSANDRKAWPGRQAWLHDLNWPYPFMSLSCIIWRRLERESEVLTWT